LLFFKECETGIRFHLLPKMKSDINKQTIHDLDLFEKARKGKFFYSFLDKKATIISAPENSTLKAVFAHIGKNSTNAYLLPLEISSVAISSVNFQNKNSARKGLSCRQTLIWKQILYQGDTHII
jgi:hypothetical protein